MKQEVKAVKFNIVNKETNKVETKSFPVFQGQNQREVAKKAKQELLLSYDKSKFNLNYKTCSIKNIEDLLNYFTSEDILNNPNFGNEIKNIISNMSADISIQFDIRDIKNTFKGSLKLLFDTDKLFKN